MADKKRFVLSYNVMHDAFEVQDRTGQVLPEGVDTYPTSEAAKAEAKGRGARVLNG